MLYRFTTFASLFYEHLRQFDESFLDGICSFGTGLKIQCCLEVVLDLLDCFCWRSVDLGSHVGFISEEHRLTAFLFVLLNFIKPEIDDVDEGSSMAEVKYDNDGICTLIISRYDCSEALLPCCVPNLQLDFLAIE